MYDGELHNKPAHAVPLALASARQHPENQKKNKAGHSPERVMEGHEEGQSQTQAHASTKTPATKLRQYLFLPPGLPYPPPSDSSSIAGWYFSWHWRALGAAPANNSGRYGRMQRAGICHMRLA